VRDQPNRRRARFTMPGRRHVIVKTGVGVVESCALKARRPNSLEEAGETVSTGIYPADYSTIA